MKISTKIFYPLVFVVLLIMPAAAGAQFFWGQNPMIGKQAIDFDIASLNGQRTSLSQYRKGGPAIVFFWATWCQYCRDELRNLQPKVETLQKRGVKVLLVNVQESPAEIRAFLNRLPLTAEVFLDADSKVSDQYGVSGLPTVFLINKDGVIIAMDHELPQNYAAALSLDSKR